MIILIQYFYVYIFVLQDILIYIYILIYISLYLWSTITVHIIQCVNKYVSGICYIWVKWYVWINAVSILIILVILLSQCFIPWLFYRLCFVGHNLHSFIDSFHNRREQQGKCSHLIGLNTIFLQFDWINILDVLKFILQDTLTLFSFSMLSHSY